MSLLVQEKKYDLHSHSTASDGELSPTELVRYAAKQGVHALALTDHDITVGLSEAGEVANELGIELISGVEISTIWNKRLIHIVGLNFDPSDAMLQSGLTGLRHQRDARGEKIAHKLEKLGVADALLGAKKFSAGQILSRAHFGRFLVDAGHVKNLNDAFKRYLGDGKPAHVSAQWVDMAEAVTWIKNAGGLAVIAHPGRYRLTATKLRLLVEAFKACGGDGLEVVSGSQDKKDTRKMADLSQRYELYASIGSDYHGPSQTWLGMGRQLPLPKECVPVWTAWTDHAGIFSSSNVNPAL